MRYSIISFLTMLFTVFILGACNRYIDVVKGKSAFERQNNFTFYLDSNILAYKSNVALKADTEIYYPKPFRVKLPKKLKYYKLSNSEEFTFYYDDEQVILIKVNLMNSANFKDTVYSPSESELSNFIEHKLYSSGGKFDIKKIDFIGNRKQTLINKGAATILLYNIIPKNNDLFFNDVNTFHFLQQ